MKQVFKHIRYVWLFILSLLFGHSVKAETDKTLIDRINGIRKTIKDAGKPLETEQTNTINFNNNAPESPQWGNWGNWGNWNNWNNWANWANWNNWGNWGNF